MKIRSTLVRFAAIAIVLFTSFAGSAQELTAVSDPQFTRNPDQMYLLEMRAGEMSCRMAATHEAQAMRRGTAPVHVIYPAPGQISTSSGLKITLRATTQLEGFPAAKAAFVNAAKVWESRIANPITVNIDVDYGSTLFGTPYPKPEILGATGDAAYNGSYSGVRALLLARGDSAAETALYNALPAGSIPTDLGAATKVSGAYIQLRALGASLPDDAPAIGFNSAYSFDLDPSNGIDPGKFDFEAVAVHEMGHALGFGSSVGSTELTPPSENIPTIWDLFRFRPGVSSSTFTTAQRPMSSGGSHVSFSGGASLQMSTGRPDSSGGDGEQSSHWKDNTGGNPFIGLMDPTVTSGTRTTLSDNDMAAFDVMGYSIRTTSSGCDAEPNETTNNASPLTLGTPCTGSVASTDASGITRTYADGTSDKIEDVFRVNLASASKLSVSLTFGSGDLDLFLFNASGTVLEESNGSTSPESFVTANTLPAGTYYVGVSAFSGSSSYTLLASAQGAAPQTPAAPSNLTATATSSSVIRLNWVDNSGNETEFRIEQRVNGSFVDIGSVPANTTTVNVTNFSAGQTGTFRVRARNASGDSGYSNEASATTPNVTGPCVPSSTTVCLLSDRFRVSIAFINQFANPPAPGNFLGGKLVAGVQNPDVATFGISSPQAIEVVVRIQDTRPFGLNRFDVYYGGLTDLEYTVSVTDTVTGTTKTYRNPPGTVGGGVDRSTFITN